MRIFLMRKLLWLSSSCLLLCTTFLIGCKVKKEIKETQGSPKVITESTRDLENGIVVPAPGTLNQKQLDSIKSIRNKEKSDKK